MPKIRRLRLLFLTLLGLASAHILVKQWDDYLVINLSDSLPHGLYVRSDQPIEVGSLVEFAPPLMAVDHAIKRWGETPDRVRFLKPVIAGPGSLISLSSSGDWLLVNGHPVASILAHDSDGNPLPCYWKNNPPRVLREHEILVISFSESSFDSRYFGVLNTAATDSDFVVRRPFLIW